MSVQVEHRKQLECLLIQHVKQQEELGQKSVGGVHEEINVEHAQEWYVQVLSICTYLGFCPVQPSLQGYLHIVRK